MPNKAGFQSKAQQRKCYAMKARGQAGSWDCDKWSHETKDMKHLPNKIKRIHASSRRRKKY